MKISYSEELHTWQKVVQAITFGYFSYKDQVTVTLTSEDEMSGIDYITWTYKRENGASTTKNVSERTETITRDQITYSKRGKQAVAGFTLKSQMQSSSVVPFLSLQQIWPVIPAR